MTTTPAPPRPEDELDWDAEQEVDFGRWWRALVAHWWLPVAGLVLGAIIGYAISLNGTQRYQATATIYLGQPYTAGGGTQVQSAQTNPSTVKTIVHSQDATGRAASLCKMKAGTIRSGVSTSAVSGNVTKIGQTPLVSISVLAGGPYKARCAADSLASSVVTNPAVAGYANRKITLFRREVSDDERTINAIDKVIAKGSVSPTDQLVAQLQLRNAQTDLNTASALLAQAQSVEAPRVITHAAASKVTARSRRTSVVVAALVGLLLGIVAALVWEPLTARARTR
jgi:capsular polysaccharide biosynthesis protein